METVLKWKFPFLIFAVLFGCGQNSSLDNKNQEQEPANSSSGLVLDIPSEEQKPVLEEGNNIHLDGHFTIHTLVKDGRSIYEATYKDHKKTENKLLPWIQDSFLFEDKYYLKVYFPFPYLGKMSIELENDPEYVLTPVEDQKYQVVINHALDLNRVDFTFHYEPAAADTLVETTYSYLYVIMEE